jgi:hypothetical protein
LAMTGAHPNVVQQVMRHQSITLTMDTYGHLFPGQEAEAIGRMRAMLSCDLSEPLKATGTDDKCQLATQEAQHQAQQLGRETPRTGATGCDARTKPAAQRESPNPLRVADLGDVVRGDATHRDSSGGGTRTHRRNIVRAK